jgi:hypothetical protein
MINLKITVHAQARFYERTIDIDHVKQAVRKPDSKTSDSYGKIKVIKRIDDRIIAVVYSEEKFRDKHNEILIITAYYIQ